MKNRGFLAALVTLLAVMCLGLFFGVGKEKESRPTDVKALLADRLKWKKASREQIEQVAYYVLGGLGSGYRYMETKRFYCGGEAHFIPIFEHEKTGLKLNLVPGGKYKRVSTVGDSNEKPVKEVRIPAFLVGQTEVTQEAWDKVGGEDNRSWRGPKLPIEDCPWTACEKWLDKAGGGLRMLSESEWEYACRAGTTTKYCFGDDPAYYDSKRWLGKFYTWLGFDSDRLGKYAWYIENSAGRTHPVGKKLPNAFGLYDMHGNLYEWCADGYADNYRDVPATHLPHSMPASRNHVIRGGFSDDSEGAVALLSVTRTDPRSFGMSL